MARIQINDLPDRHNMTAKEQKCILGGWAQPGDGLCGAPVDPRLGPSSKSGSATPFWTKSFVVGPNGAEMKYVVGYGRK